jgi:hypothetical protein
MCESGNEKTEVAIAQQSEKTVKQEFKRVQRIRNRSSYLLFQQLYDFLKTNPNMGNILRKFYEILDAKRSFGSRRNAEYAAESLDWVLKDNT